MKLFHTSPQPITEIHGYGLFGDFLFFSSSEYVMTAGDYVTYTIEIDENDILDAEEIFFDPDSPDKLEGLTQEVMAMVGCDEDTACDLISQHTNVYAIDCGIDPENLSDVDWDIQRASGEAAVLLGYRGAAMTDEQGRSYLIKMACAESLCMGI